MRNTSFTLHTDDRAQWELLPDDRAGRVIKAVYAYADGDEVPELEDAEKMLFTALRAQLDRETAKNNAILAKRREAGRLGGMAKASKCQLPSVANASKSLANHSTDQRNKAKQLFDEGHGPAEIGRILGVSSNTIRTWKLRDKWEETV